MKNRFMLIIGLITLCFNVSAKCQYSVPDSIKVVTLLHQGKRLNAGINLMIYYARQLKGIPYVARTLEENDKETLIINLHQLDCTTYVENVLALTLCAKHAQFTFEDFCNWLQKIRYKNGAIAYTNRLHYFSEWIADNTAMGFVEETQSPTPPFSHIQTLRINYMSTHPKKYPMLVRHPEWIKEIAKMENQLNGKKYHYIPKSSISNTSVYRKTIHNGDIIAITTNKEGLDTSHIGIAIWHKDGLHMLNASRIRHQVIEEPMTLKTYMAKQPSQTGIRIIRVK